MPLYACSLDIFKSPCYAIVNPVNCGGVSGKGLALQFKQRFPENHQLYAAACRRGEVMPGKMFLTRPCGNAYPTVIVNFPTKRHWRDDARLIDIDDGLLTLRQLIIDRGWPDIFIPPLGCGLGGLNWYTQVFPLFEHNLQDMAAKIYIASPIKR